MKYFLSVLTCMFALLPVQVEALAVYQSVGCTTSLATTCLFSTAPSIGHEIVIFSAQPTNATCASMTVSNTGSGIAVTPIVFEVSGSNSCTGLYMSKLTAATTTSFTFSAAVKAVMIETDSTFATSRNAGGTGTATATTSPTLAVNPGGILLCGGASDLASATATMSSAQVTLSTTFGDIDVAGGYAILGTTIAGTCTISVTSHPVTVIAVSLTAPAAYPGNGMVGYEKAEPPEWLGLVQFKELLSHW
jgi:hypothetical protein